MGTQAEAVRVPVQLIDGRHFRVRFDDVRTGHDFYFRMVDTQGVKSERHVVIKPEPRGRPGPI